MATVDDFKGNFIDGARPNKYEMFIDGMPEKVKFLCKASQLPSSNTGNVVVPYQGYGIKVAGDKTFDDWTATFMLDTDFSVRNALEEWDRSVKTYDNSSGSATNINDYKRSATIIQLDNSGESIAEYKFEGIFPVNIGNVEMAFDSNDTISEYAVTFAVDYWEKTS